MVKILKELKEDLAKVSADNVALKKDLEDKVAELEKSIEEASTKRKKDFEDTKVSDRVLDKAIEDGKDLYFKSAILNRDLESFSSFKDVAGIIEKALVPSNITNWLDEAFSKDVVEALENELQVAALFNKVVVPNGVESLSIPSRTGNLTSYLIAAGADAIESAVTAGKINMKPVKFKTLTAIADESSEEAVTAVLALSKQELTKSLARAVENAIVMGDTTIADGNDTNKAYDGLFKIGKASSIDAGGVALTEAMILAARAGLGIAGVNPNDLVFVVNSVQYIKLLGMGLVKTMDTFGADATIVKGSLGKVWGIDIMVSDYIPSTLTAAGVNDGTGATTAGVLLNKSLFLRSERQKGVVSKSDTNITADTTLLAASYSNYFANMAVGQTSAVTIINILP